MVAGKTTKEIKWESRCVGKRFIVVINQRP